MAMDILAYTFGVIALVAATNALWMKTGVRRCTVNQRISRLQMQKT